MTAVIQALPAGLDVVCQRRTVIYQTCLAIALCSEKNMKTECLLSVGKASSAGSRVLCPQLGDKDEV